ncbi:MAG: hypothetical protein QW786_03085 [Candidatus Hadarchaeum sp.]
MAAVGENGEFGIVDRSPSLPAAEKTIVGKVIADAILIILGRTS